MIRIARVFFDLYLIQDSKDDQDLSQFYFEKYVKTSVNFSTNSSKPRHKDLNLWHFRLGHTPLEKINIIHQTFPNVK